jgi:hypothetical protein
MGAFLSLFCVLLFALPLPWPIFHKVCEDCEVQFLNVTARGRTTCESCRSVDVRRWQREGRLRAGQYFSYSSECGGEPFGGISVRTERDAVVLTYRALNWGATEGKSIEQRVPITWTPCHLGGQRPWFVCSVYSASRYCGRRVAVLYNAGELFAYRRCYGLAYASQQETPRYRGVGRIQKIRMQLGGSASLIDPFPEKPKGMHWRTFLRLRARVQSATLRRVGHIR